MKPILVPDDFKISARVYELAEENNIPQTFVDKQVKEFIFYWQDRRTKRNGWQRTFWNCVKMKWATGKQTKSAANKVWESKPVKVASKKTARYYIELMKHGSITTIG